MRLRANMFTGHGYGPGGYFPGLKFKRSGNFSASAYFPSGTAPLPTGTASGAPWKTFNGSVSGYPTHGPTHGPYPLPSAWKRSLSYPSGTIGTAASTGDPSGKVPWYSGTAASTGFASAPSSFGTSGKFTYTAPKGIPTEYFYHHKKPKRKVSRFFP